MQRENLIAILKDHKLRITNCRLEVISLFISENKALSQGDLENKITKYDRATLYRTLNSFLVTGLLHKIPNESGFATYGLYHKNCYPKNHAHDHIHFKCNKCGKIECLDTIPLKTEFKLPNGYITNQLNVIVDGICKNCND